jgi:hypothetical protein
VSETSGRTKGTSKSRSSGRSEALFKRRLLPPEEIGRNFARIENKANPFYPGLALALMSGQDTTAVRRVKYFEDIAFIGLFRAHPDHPFNAPREFSLQSAALDEFNLSWRLTVPKGTLVNAGDVIGYACRTDASGKEEVMTSWPAITAPVSGRVIQRPPMPPLAASGLLTGLGAADMPGTDLLLKQYGLGTEVSKFLKKTPVMSALSMPSTSAILTYEAVDRAPDPFAALRSFLQGLKQKQEARTAKKAVETRAATHAAFKMIEEGKLSTITKRRRKLLWWCGGAGIVTVAALALSLSAPGTPVTLTAFAALAGFIWCALTLFQVVKKERKQRKAVEALSSPFAPFLLRPSTTALSQALEATKTKFGTADKKRK